ncbi:unnamed protein product [Gordionus sp. m RMFG-2023]|uniref:uncharacterized protein LOC135929002 n=1 Tax=Gordionus sp. m RMFG-2023 TaxID=3053472 RepID=UPI0030DF5DFC
MTFGIIFLEILLFTFIVHFPTGECCNCKVCPGLANCRANCVDGEKFYINGFCQCYCKKCQYAYDPLRRYMCARSKFDEKGCVHYVCTKIPPRLQNKQKQLYALQRYADILN